MNIKLSLPKRAGYACDDQVTALGTFVFDRFRLLPSRRLLEVASTPVPLGGKAFDILTLLVLRAGSIVTKEELFAEVWPNVAVDRINLRVRMVELRKALSGSGSGVSFVKTVPNHGYCFTAKVTYEYPAKVDAQAGCHLKNRSLPAALSRIIGRDKTIQKISSQLLAHRLVSIVGPGGIGKTTIALSVGNMIAQMFDDGVYFVDLGPVNDPNLILSVIGTQLGLVLQPEDPLATITRYLHEKRVLVVLDCCERITGAVTAVIGRVLFETLNVHILTTSRESLRMQDERIHRLLPLEGPPENTSMSAKEALAFPAVQLLVERIIANRNDFVLSDADASTAAAICRRLDGIALAIELVAGHVGTFGLRGAAALLDNQFGTMTNLRRFALPRHQTMFATLDWSYNLLQESEREMARALSIFIGPFTLEAVQTLIKHPIENCREVEASLTGLCSKSIVSIDNNGKATYYRILDTTRSYLATKISSGAELNKLARQHASYYGQILEAARASSPTFHDADWFDSVIQQIGNIRAALEWTFSDNGDAGDAIALTTSSSSIFIDLSLLTECLRWTKRALDCESAWNKDPV